MTPLLLTASLLFAPLLTSAAMAGSDDDTESLALRRITLYRSGVGYFEHAGQVQGDHSVQMRFDAGKVNDILKSMTILDLGGGRIGPVSYGSKEPLSRRLASFGVDISGSPDNAQLFAQLRGAGLQVGTLDGAFIEGTILGVEERNTVAPAGQGAAVLSRKHVNLLTDTGVRSVAIGDLVSWKLSDDKLAQELMLALAALAEQRTERIKSLGLSFLAEPELRRQVVVSYVHEMPVWKTSYRLVLPDEDGDEPKLQGWAIVENTTDEAWQNVQLGLASGRPSSFTMDLYEPIFTQRPDVPVPTEAGLVARNYESNRRQSRGPESPGAPSESKVRRGLDMGGGGGGRMNADFDGLSQLGYKDEFRDAMISGGSLGESQATGQQAGGQFLYQVDTPVTLERQRSAMLPILLSDIDGRRVSIFNLADGSKHPLRGVEMTNDTRLHLMPGPIAVYDGGTYAGDAQIPHTARNQKRLLAYALDLDVAGSTETKGKQTLVAIKIVDGLVEQRTKVQNRVTYNFINYDAEGERTLLVEHSRSQGWDLITPEEAHETTDNLYRFELPLAKAGEASITVTEEIVQSTRYQLTQLDLDTLLSYQRNGKASRAVVEAVSKAAALQARARDFQQDIARLDQERGAISQEQARIRENLARIQQGSDLSRRYVSKLGEQEDRLEEIQEQRTALDDAKTLAEKELQSFLRDLSVE